jgi:hypothetical protein
VRPDGRAVPFDRADVRRGQVMREDQFAPGAGAVIGAEKQPGQRIGVDVAFEPHRRAALDIEDDAVPVVIGRHDGLGPYLLGQVEKQVPVVLVQPGQVSLEVTGMQPAARDMVHVRGLTGQDRRARVVPELGFGGGSSDFLPPVIGQQAGHVECGPMESRRHQARPVDGSGSTSAHCGGQTRDHRSSFRSDELPALGDPASLPRATACALGDGHPHGSGEGVPHPLRGLACGVVGGQTAALSVEGIVLGSATITATPWGRSARSGTVRTDGRSA